MSLRHLLDANNEGKPGVVSAEESKHDDPTSETTPRMEADEKQDDDGIDYIDDIEKRFNYLPPKFRDKVIYTLRRGGIRLCGPDFDTISDFAKNKKSEDEAEEALGHIQRWVAQKRLLGYLETKGIHDYQGHPETRLTKHIQKIHSITRATRLLEEIKLDHRSSYKNLLSDNNLQQIDLICEMLRALSEEFLEGKEPNYNELFRQYVVLFHPHLTEKLSQIPLTRNSYACLIKDLFKTNLTNADAIFDAIVELRKLKPDYETLPRHIYDSLTNAFVELKKANLGSEKNYQLLLANIQHISDINNALHELTPFFLGNRIGQQQYELFIQQAAYAHQIASVLSDEFDRAPVSPEELIQHAPYARDMADCLLLRRKIFPPDKWKAQHPRLMQCGHNMEHIAKSLWLLLKGADSLNSAERTDAQKCFDVLVEANGQNSKSIADKLAAMPKEQRSYEGILREMGKEIFDTARSTRQRGENYELEALRDKTIFNRDIIMQIFKFFSPNPNAMSESDKTDSLTSTPPSPESSPS